MFVQVPAFRCNQFTANNVATMRDELDQDIHRPSAHKTDVKKPSKHAITVAMKNLDSKPTTTKV